MRKSIIVAASQNGVIGANGQLPWHLPDDLKRFKELTMGHTLIMGRKTYESLPPKLRPLPGRTTIVLSRAKGKLTNYGSQAVMFTVQNLEDALSAAKNSNEAEVFICGGGAVYREALFFVDRVYLTVVERDFEGDTYFAMPDTWRASWQRHSVVPVEGELPYRFEIWDRV